VLKRRLTAAPKEDVHMRRWLFILVAAAVVVTLSADYSDAQVYVGDQHGGWIYRFSGGDTVGVVVNPEARFLGVKDMELEAEGRLLLARGGKVVRFDPDEQTIDLLDDAGPLKITTSCYPDGETTDTYLTRFIILPDEGEQWPWFPPELQYLPDSMGPAETAYVFEESSLLLDVQVYPYPPDDWHILVLSAHPPSIAELRRTGPTTWERLDDAYSGDGGNLRAFALRPGGEILVVDYVAGVFQVVEGDLVPFGDLEGPGLRDITIGSDGTVYVVDSHRDVVHRLDPDGNRILPALGEGTLWTPRVAVAAGFTPSPPGENVPTNPIENVEILFEEIVEGGYTTAVTVPSTERVSPQGNFLPDYVDPPGGRGDFTYIDVDTESVYSRLIQIDVYLEGTRMFYAHATGDTFRDVTIEGSIEDARGTISRFSEVVLVEDTRELTTVIAYKFQRLIRLLEKPPPVGTSFCPDGGVGRFLGYTLRAKAVYDEGMTYDAMVALTGLNARVRALAGWCTPDTAPNNLAGEILARSKTLLYSLSYLGGESRGQEATVETALALTVTSPAQGRSLVELAGPADVEVAARVYNTAGQLVATLFEGRLPGGRERIVWRGTDDSGARVASGVYFVRLEAEGEVRSSKVVLIR